ncbi:MAG: 3'(2'),5'-bisphosphate nucleotidase CysQ [Brevundimonas sp.]|uniref:3'(2'),5'-bisphosphate nucleotidase CysQ n=1 Tax=Brevundimonas sp. TaxID=1871086 RepID=UPI002735B6B7|nr:3'(2'),5'-bisphosphate nucleotidase CysQ [Brevundimonas sp.]MBX9614185.1 3'(2'),5'-bisphosphate nucleotidase CysQ [Caulobacteraceae bacterium]MDP3404310.1 3'(2'),5'-bisphosphate nucleotidase CysQ [Brevundimonas sp.]
MSDPGPIDLAADLALIRAAARAGGILAEQERTLGLTVTHKDGGSPVTNADMAVDTMLKAMLLAARPDYGWLSEETPDTPDRLTRRRIFVVDPIDGTVAFMKARPWWCVPIAVVEDGQPVAAVIHVPSMNDTFEATVGGGARLNDRPITASDVDTLDDAAVLADARLMEGPHWPEPWPPMRYEKRNALAYRMALVASGAFDAAIALTPKFDWDVCAGALIATEAGGRVSDHHGRPWVFNRPDPRQASLVCSAPALHPLILRRTAPIPLAQ